MPVPVPLYTKQSAHPVIKHPQHSDSDSRPSLFQYATHSLPLPPRGPPPAFATREEWINSLPDWRRNKPRAVWEDDNIRHYTDGSGFNQGLTVADNATVIKGAPAQACIPPVSTLMAGASYVAGPAVGMYPSPAEDADDEMSPIDEEDGWHSDVSLTRTDIEMQAFDSDNDSVEFASGYATHDENVYPQSFVDRGVFTPLNEDTSSDFTRNHDPSSSPVGPTTPFGDYVERALAGPQNNIHYGSHRHQTDVVSQSQYTYEECCGNQCYQCQQQYDHRARQVTQPAPVSEPATIPSSNGDYKKLTEPLAEWMANFVWKVCTTGVFIQPQCGRPRYVGGVSLPNKPNSQSYSGYEKHYSHSPPSSLARNIHSLFMSTLLQPSAIFLALHYIVKLPVFFGPCQLGREDDKEECFRYELLKENYALLEREAEAYTPFRLVLLGCMLANKWLDDHTFSNKTWYDIHISSFVTLSLTPHRRHSISNVPIQSLNRLEALALGVFKYDLTISPVEWSRWLDTLMSYHVSLSSPAFPQPISRPSTSPHTIIRRSLETLIHANQRWSAHPEHPVFLGLEEKRREVEQLEQTYAVDLADIDLDAEGPLRHEYVPKRRSSGASSVRQSRSQERQFEPVRQLPPPARWSPAGDELVHPKAPSHYMAPQPVVHLPPLQRQSDVRYRAAWPWARDYEYPVGLPSMFVPQHSNYDYGYAPPPAMSHSRSQSLSYHPPAPAPPQGHYRSYSQSRYDHYAEHNYAPAPAPAPSSNWGSYERQAYATYDRPTELHNRIPLKV